MPAWRRARISERSCSRSKPDAATQSFAATQSRHVSHGEYAAMPYGLNLALAIARLAVAAALLPFAFDWRSPSLASVRMWALALLIGVPAALIVAEVRSLRRAEVPRSARAVGVAALAVAAVGLMSVLAVEAHFH